MDASELSLPASRAGGPVPPESRLPLPAAAAIPVPFYDMGAAEEPPAGNVIWSVLHALRRRWLAVAVLGTIVGAGASAAVWFGMKTQYTATARLWIPSKEGAPLLDSQRRTSGDFDLRKRTQAQLITSPAVLESVLTRDEIKGLPIVRMHAQDEQLAWLKSCVSVGFPDNAELMELRVRCPDKQAASDIARTIRQVYLDDVVWLSFTERQVQIEQLEADLEQKKARFRQEQDKLTALEKQAQTGTGGLSHLTPEEQRAQRQYEQGLERLNQIERELWNAQRQLFVMQTMASSAERAELLVSDEELQQFADADPAIQKLRRHVESLNRQMQLDAEKLSGPAYEEALAARKRQIEDKEKELATQLEQLRLQVSQQKRQQLTQQDPAVLQVQVDFLLQQRAALEEQLANGPPTSPSGAAPPTTSIEYQKFQVNSILGLMSRLQQRLDDARMSKLDDWEEQQKSGIRAAGPVYVLDVVDKRRKFMQAGAAGGGAFLAVAAVLVLLDLRRRRLNHPGDVSDRLQLHVLGTIPLLRGRGSKRLESSSRLAEAVDGVAATLLCRTTGEDHRVVMISSAMAGEGKTTLAANLATSLAAAGRRTLLVDFDLRRPMLHQVYQLLIGPGLGEILSSGDVSLIDDVLQETTTENLWLIPAGAKRQRALAELTDERVDDLFRELRERFEFIVVDGPPVLPVVDTRLIARHADGVVISLLRDVSELPKVKSACQLLQSYHVPVLGGVVIGAAGDVYYGYPPERVPSTA